MLDIQRDHFDPPEDAHMFRSRRLPAVGALLLALTTGTVPAWAHDRSSGGQTRSAAGHPAPIRGLVTSVGSSSLKVQTSSGSVTVTFTAATKVARMVTGSTADLKAGQFIDAQFVTGTTTIRSIRIDAARGHEPPPDWRIAPHYGRPHWEARWTYSEIVARKDSRQREAYRTQTRVGGQILSVTPGSVTVRNRRGQAVVYALTRDVTVTKAVVGKISDLAPGETVQVCPDHGVSAAFITILSS
jgi:hypothetical protein